MPRTINSSRMSIPTMSEKGGGVMKVERGNVLPSVRTTSSDRTLPRDSMFGGNKPECRDS